MENFPEHDAKNFTKKFLTVTEKSKKQRNFSLTYYVNNHVYSKLKSLGKDPSQIPYKSASLSFKTRSTCRFTNSIRS